MCETTMSAKVLLICPGEVKCLKRMRIGRDVEGYRWWKCCG